MTTSQLSQKEYLKRYLGGKSDKKKKKRKKVTPTVQRMRIVDDDIDPANIQELAEGDLDLYELAENAPQIAGIVDERPAELQALETFGNRAKWRILANDNEDIQIEQVGNVAKHNENNSDVSPPRMEQTHEDSDLSPARPQHENSGTRKLKSKNLSKRNPSSDISPPRYQSSTGNLKSKHSGHDEKRKRHRSSDSDLSLPRCNEKRKRHRSSGSDLSPPRHSKSGKHASKRKNRHLSPKPCSSDSDLSPPRHSKAVHKRKSRDLSPRHSSRRSCEKSKSTHSSRRENYESDSDVSPPRIDVRLVKREPDSDLSPPRNVVTSEKTATKHSRWNRGSESKRHASHSHRTRESDSDLSPPRSIINARHIKKEPGAEKRTLDGKKAGLQDAKSLKEDLEKFKAKEQEYFDKMTDEISGRGATAIVRDRKTGKKRDFQREEVERLKKEKEKQAKLEKFKELHTGLVQVQEKAAKIQDMIHESSKPLARYADDMDLENMLKAQEREGDPMLEYLREKRQAENPNDVKPKYKGPQPPPNRFNIPPGHKWDGVDRSTGFEKKLFEHRSAKKALEEEAYKWSVADM